MLKDQGFGFVKIQSGSFDNRPKTHPSRQKGIRGGSVGPMTLTSAWRDINRKTAEDLRNALSREILRDEDATVKYDYGKNEIKLVFPKNKTKNWVYHFYWERFDTYLPSAGYDPSYQTYWLIPHITEEPR